MDTSTDALQELVASAVYVALLTDDGLAIDQLGDAIYEGVSRASSSRDRTIDRATQLSEVLRGE